MKQNDVEMSFMAGLAYTDCRPFMTCVNLRGVSPSPRSMASGAASSSSGSSCELGGVGMGERVEGGCENFVSEML